MILLEFLRRRLFWILDFFKGGKVRKHYNDIRFIQENQAAPIAKRRKEEYLQNILAHAYKTVPFYEKGLNGISLEDYPIINKTTIRENFEQFKSQLYLNDNKKHRVYTSGSTGNPFEIYHDHNKRERNTADTIYFAEKAGFKLGTRLYYLRLWDKQYKKSKHLSWFQNISMHSVDELNDKNITKLISQLQNDNSNKNILAYSSSLETVCKFLDKTQAKSLDIKIHSVIAIAESLNSYVKESMKKYFNVKVISRYSNSENGIFAQQITESNICDFKINHASYYFEILDIDRDIPVKPGILGRIVVTDLFNYCMPMIRYDTGDVGIMDYSSEGQLEGLAFTKIEGRKMDMFTNTKGELISAHIIHKILQYDGIEQFQFIVEESMEYTIKLKVLDKLDFSKEDRIIREYQDYFGKDSVVKIMYVDEIAPLPSGKRKLVVNNVIKRKTLIYP